MTLIITSIYFIALIWLTFKYLNASEVENKIKIGGETYEVRFTGLEYVVIILIATGIMGLLPILALHLLFVEVMCVIILQRAEDRPIFSVPIKIFFVFIFWAILGLTYTPSIEYGIRMLLKYIYPPLIALTCSAVVKDYVVFLRTAYWCRILAAISFVAYYLPMHGFVFLGVFWNRAALATNYIIWAVFSFALYSSGTDRKKNLLWGIAFILPCLIWVFRTDIFGTSVALAAFFFIKYRFKSLPLIMAMACLAVCAIFFIPSVKSKMYFRPDEVSFEDFISGNVEENNINTSGRNAMWEDVEKLFYEGHELKGSGTGRVQKYFYTEVYDWRRGGQLHNELLLLQCDNGLIGLGLFIASYILILFHCTKIYQNSEDERIKTVALTAGSSLFGLLVTLYSDNTVSYSLCTLGIPWAFYGMALGMLQKEKLT